MMGEGLWTRTLERCYLRGAAPLVALHDGNAVRLAGGLTPDISLNADALLSRPVR